MALAQRLTTAASRLFKETSTSQKVFPAVLCQLINRRTMSDDAKDDVIVQEVGDVGILVLNRPKALNALNLSMVNKILPALLKWESSKRMVLIKGTGGKAFCAGGDVRAVTIASKNGETYGKDFFRQEYLTNYVIGTYRIPYVALIDGITMGGGIGLSVHGKYRVATEKTLCAMPETAIGLFPDVGGSFFLPRLQNRLLGLYLALTGYRLKGVDNLMAGIATHYCHSSELEQLEKVLMNGKVGNVQDLLEPYTYVPPDAKFSLDPVMDKINHIFDAKTLEEIFKNLEEDKSEWAAETLASLKKFSPLSMKITMKELKLGRRHQSLRACLQMEYRLACRACDGHDFIEGVRALLVDKDQNPKWKPPTIEEVTEEMVDACFAPLPEEQELSTGSLYRPRKSAL